MTRMSVLACGLLLAIFAAPAPARSSAPEEVFQPNILVLVVDDVGVDFLAPWGFGTDLPYTPNIDALSAGGVRFTDAWAMPLCTPTRAALQTGRHGFRTGVGTLVSASFALELAETTLPEMLDIGTGYAYAHGCFGKWHLGNPSVGGPLAPNLAGYSHFEGTVHNFVLPDTFYDWAKVENGVTKPCSGYATSAVVNDTLGWIGAQSSPWFAMVNFHAPHWPWHTPPAHLYSTSLAHAPPPNIDPRPYAKAMMEAVDAEIGRLFAALGSSFEDTLVVLLADNGTDGLVVKPPFLPWKAKATIFEPGIRVPLIVSGPGVTPGVCAALVHVVDVFPTVAEAARVNLGLSLPDLKIDGISLWPYLENPAAPSQRKLLYTEQFWPNGHNPPSNFDRTIRDERFKYVWSTVYGHVLFDLKFDPFETVNLFDQPPLDPVAKRAFRKLKKGLLDLLSDG